MTEYYPINYKVPCNSDLTELLLLEDLCFRFNQPYRKVLGHYFPSPVGLCLCAYLENRPIGYIFLIFTAKMNTAAINAIVVHPRLRKQGIGQNLLQKAVIEAAKKGATKIYCEVSFNNEATSGLLSDARFLDTFDDPVLLPNSSDGMRLVLKLSGDNISIAPLQDDMKLNLTSSMRIISKF